MYLETFQTILEIKNDTSLLLQKPYLRTNYNKSNVEEDIDLKISLELQIYQILYTYEKQLQKYMLIINLTIQV